MEPVSITNEQLEQSVKEGRKMRGSLNSDPEIKFLEICTRHLSDLEPSSPIYPYINFLLRFANDQPDKIRALEAKCDDLCFELLKMKKPEMEREATIQNTVNQMKSSNGRSILFEPSARLNTILNDLKLARIV